MTRMPFRSLATANHGPWNSLVCSKPIPHSLLSARGVDALSLRLAEGNELAEPWTHSGFATYVELDVAAMPRMARDFAPAAQSSGALRYVLLRRRSD